MLIGISDIADVILGIVAIGFSVYTFKRGTSSPYDKERYEDLIYPIFTLIEPFLYKPINAEIEEVFKSVIEIIERERKIAGSKLTDNLKFDRVNQDSYNTFCSHISREYDRLSRRLGLSVRSIDYRMNNRQFRNKFALVFYVMANLLITLVVGWFVLSILLSIFDNFMNFTSIFDIVFYGTPLLIILLFIRGYY